MRRVFPRLFAIGFTGALVGCASGGSPLAQTLPRGVRLRFNEEFYGFRADNAGDIAEALSRFGPKFGGKRALAVTRQELEWDFELAGTNDACRLQSAEVRLDITMILPEWLDAESGPEPLQARWREFEEAVRKHEDDHVRLFIEGARDLLRRIQRVQAGTCETVELEVDEQARISREHLAERQSQYDRDTRGGQTQGVCWTGPCAGVAACGACAEYWRQHIGAGN